MTTYSIGITATTELAEDKTFFKVCNLETELPRDILEKTVESLLGCNYSYRIESAILPSLANENFELGELEKALKWIAKPFVVNIVKQHKVHLKTVYLTETFASEATGFTFLRLQPRSEYLEINPDKLIEHFNDLGLKLFKSKTKDLFYVKGDIEVNIDWKSETITFTKTIKNVEIRHRYRHKR